MCEMDTWAVSPTWNVRLSPVSGDNGQYSTSRGEKGDRISRGFELAKALVRGLPLPRPPSFQGQLGSYRSYDLSEESAQAGPRLWPGRGIRGATSDRPVGLCSSSRSLRPTQPGTALPRAVPTSVTRGTLPRPGLDLLDSCDARGDSITMKPFCHPRNRRSDVSYNCSGGNKGGNLNLSFQSPRR